MYLSPNSLQTLRMCLISLIILLIKESDQPSLFQSLCWFIILIHLKPATQLTAEPTNGAQALPADPLAPLTVPDVGAQDHRQDAFKSGCL